MDNERIEGTGHQVKLTFKRAVGKTIGDAKLSADGAAERTCGEAQSAAALTGRQFRGIDADGIKGIAHQLEGALKEGIGNAISNPGLRQAGIAEREAGRVQNAAGGARDMARDAVEKGE